MEPMSIIVKNTDFYNVTPCGVVETYWPFQGTYCRPLSGGRNLPPRRRQISLSVSCTQYPMNPVYNSVSVMSVMCRLSNPLKY